MKYVKKPEIDIKLLNIKYNNKEFANSLLKKIKLHKNKLFHMKQI